MIRNFANIAVAALLVVPAPLAAAATPADVPVRLSDAQSFESPLAPGITPVEISTTRRKLASAVCAEKFMDGVKTVVAVALAVYLAWPSPSSSADRVVVPQQRWWVPAASGGA